MGFYRVYHVNAAGKTVDHSNFQAANDTAACETVRTIKKQRGWHVAELWVNVRYVACPEHDPNVKRGAPWGRRVDLAEQLREYQKTR
jgi:hypothetical protein